MMMGVVVAFPDRELPPRHPDRAPMEQLDAALAWLREETERMVPMTSGQRARLAIMADMVADLMAEALSGED